MRFLKRAYLLNNPLTLTKLSLYEDQAQPISKPRDTVLLNPHSQHSSLQIHLKKMRTNQTTMTFLTNLARAAVGIGATAAFADSAVYTVDGGERAVLFDRFRGVLNNTVGEGTHILIPWLQKPYIFDIRTRHHTFSSISGTKDLQMVNLTLRVLSRPEVNQLPSIFKTLGLEYDEKVLPSIGNEVLKAVVSQFNADQLLTDRAQVL
ncbi:putative prohibitin, Band 7 domain, Band 7/SPFH domain superfamily [Helianthus debilis subsp. tardiflorus]